MKKKIFLAYKWNKILSFRRSVTLEYLLSADRIDLFHLQQRKKLQNVIKCSRTFRAKRAKICF